MYVYIYTYIHSYIHTHKGIIKLCCTSKKTDQAMDFFTKMKSQNVDRKRRTYAPLFTAFAERIDQCINTGQNAEEDKKKCLIRAIEVFEDVGQQKVDLVEEDFVALVRLCGACGEKEYMEKALDSMGELIYALQVGFF